MVGLFYFMSDYNAEAEAKQKEIDKETKRKRDSELNDLRKLLSQPEFRRYLWRELERCGVFAAIFNSNAMIMSHNEGARSIGISLLVDLMEANPNAFAQIQAEQYSATKSKKQGETDGRAT